MTVLFVMNCPSPDRTPTLNQLASECLDFSVIYLTEGGSEHGWGALDLRHPHRIAHSKRQAASWIVRDVLGAGVDIVVCHGYRTLPYATALTVARLKRTQVILRSDTNIDAIRGGGRAKRTTRRVVGRTLIPRDAIAWTIGTKNAVFWSAEFGVAQLELIPFDTPRLPGGIPPRARSRQIDDPLRVLYVGRLVSRKRVEDAIAAARLVGDRIPWILTVVGRGPEQDHLRLLAAGDERIRFVGAIAHDDLGSYFAESDVLVLPSSYEPWGLVVNEALGFGLRVIASDAVGAAADLITDANGAVFPVGEVEALAAELIRSAEFTHQEPRPPSQDTADLMLESIGRIRQERQPQNRTHERAASATRRRGRRDGRG